jgi:hypothetical protein
MIRAIGSLHASQGRGGWSMPAKRYNPGVGLVSCLIVAELAELLGRTAYAVFTSRNFSLMN